MQYNIILNLDTSSSKSCTSSFKTMTCDLDTNEADQAGSFLLNESSQKNQQKPKLLTSLSPRRATLPTSQLMESWD